MQDACVICYHKQVRQIRKHSFYTGALGHNSANLDRFVFKLKLKLAMKGPFVAQCSLQQLCLHHNLLDLLTFLNVRESGNESDANFSE